MAKKRQTVAPGPVDKDFVLEDYPLYNLVRTAATYSDEMSKALKDYGLDLMKWRILMLLHDQTPSSVGELARRSVTKTPTLTRVLMRMEKDGLVTRRALEGDRRIVQVEMTSKAADTLKLVRSIGQKVFTRAFEGVPSADAASMTRTLKQMRANLARSPYDAGSEMSKPVKAAG